MNFLVLGTSPCNYTRHTFLLRLNKFVRRRDHISYFLSRLHVATWTFLQLITTATYWSNWKHRERSNKSRSVKEAETDHLRARCFEFRASKHSTNNPKTNAGKRKKKKQREMQCGYLYQTSNLSSILNTPSHQTPHGTYPRFTYVISQLLEPIPAFSLSKAF